MKSGNIIKVLFIVCLLNLIFTRNSAASVVINEIHPGEEWVELFNTADTLKELDTCTLRMGSDSQQINLTSENIIGNGYKVFEKGVTAGWSTNWLNNGGDSVELLCTDFNDGPVDYPSMATSNSYARTPNGTGAFEITGSVTKNSVNGQISSTPTPTGSATSTPSQSQATVNITDAKDGDGQILSTVKIFIDGTYINHYVPETLTFCDGCFCSNAACGFGNHTFRFEKSGFGSYEKSENISVGGSYQISPILSSQENSSETETSSPSPQSPKPTAGFSVSLPLSSTPEPQVMGGTENGENERVLGIQEVGNANVTDESNGEDELRPKLPTASYIFLFAGFLLLGYSGYALVARKKAKSKSVEGGLTNKNTNE